MNILGIIIILVKGGAPEGGQNDKMEVTLSGIRTFRDLSGLETASRDLVQCSYSQDLVYSRVPSIPKVSRRSDKYYYHNL